MSSSKDRAITAFDYCAVKGGVPTWKERCKILIYYCILRPYYRVKPVIVKYAPRVRLLPHTSCFWFVARLELLNRQLVEIALYKFTKL